LCNSRRPKRPPLHERRFRLHHALDRLVNVLTGDPSAHHCVPHSRNGGVGVDGEKDLIDTCFERTHRGLACIEMRGETAHVHGVGDDEFVECKVAAQQVDDRLRQRGRHGPVPRHLGAHGSVHVLEIGTHRHERRVERRDGEVADHDGRDVRIDGGAERHELDGLEALPCDMQGRQRAMGVDVSVAVAGKVFRARQHAFLLEAAHECSDVPRHVMRIFTEAAGVDDGIERIDVDVGDGREDVIDTDGERLARGHTRLLFGKRGLAGRRERHRRQPPLGVAEAHAHSGFEISADEQRHPRERLQMRVHGRGFGGGGLEPDHATNMVVAHVMNEIGAGRRHNEQLPDLGVEVHGSG
jgi:hypothetical protein